MDDELEIDPQRASLEQAIALLKPLRQHRQARAERQQRQARQALQHSCEQLLEAESRLSEQSDAQRVRRARLASEHLQQSMGFEEVGRWHDRERRMLDQLAMLRHDVHRQQALIEERQAQLQHACTSASQAQRAVEKLACLAEALNDES
ncbi:hypothetical protein SAMN05216588_105291 [Pseudomonas flavescens]|uniref:Type III secretion protein YscO n=1 Tax=Phytopseudomonas flavescens TaxID=29435 RepID=A0A1G8DK30_9GAMM|nr:type III secretion protein [Pseudomonas flavescens]SDH58028.1 hypothetical protein SAMN05216588_105291 [Pseudomonas flavescens]